MSPSTPVPRLPRRTPRHRGTPLGPVLLATALAAAMVYAVFFVLPGI